MAIIDRAAPLSAEAVERIRRTRRHPRPTQFDYLHLRHLVDDLESALRADSAASDVLDVFCGSRPYEDLLPRHAHRVGLDLTDRYGVADVVSDQFLPFPDRSFDLVLCIEAFHFVPEPGEAVCEIARVLRPGGRVIIAVPLVWQYSRIGLEHRFTASSLAKLFGGWEDVRVVENGGWAVTWTSVTASACRGVEERLARLAGSARGPVAAAFALLYTLLNGLGSLLDAIERRIPPRSATLPTNLLLTARRPLDD